MSKSENSDRGNENPVQTTRWLSRFGLWSALLLLAVAAGTVFTICACKTSGSGNW